ncbi:MAG TPA: hypothetical protein VK453_18050 [Micromonosporaceae bacterium]|nr:hypothetical protein [Micromonosporaceae bacterium]
MRRSAGVLLWVSVLLAVSAAPASAAPAPSPSTAAPAGVDAPRAEPPQTVCTIDDSRIREISGLVALADGYAVVNDSNRDQSAQRIFRVDSACKYRGVSTAYQPNSLDPEDLAVAADGTLWSADIGDNAPLTGGSGARRATVALWKLAPKATRPVIYRFTYPDGPHDAEAVLLTADGTPLIVTKELMGAPAGLYAPTEAPVPNTAAGVGLKRLGEFTPQQTRTPNPLGPAGSGAVTGGAVSPDGKRVALRTYSDAYEWDVPDGDVVKAITTGRPRVTPLPNEQGGESLAYTRDGKFFLTVPDVDGPAAVLRYTPAAAAAPSAPPSEKAKALADNRSFLQRITLQEIMRMVIAVGLLGVLLVAVGVVGIRRSRAARRAEAASGARGVASVTRTPPNGGPGPVGAPAGSNAPGAAPTATRKAKATATVPAVIAPAGPTTPGVAGPAQPGQDRAGGRVYGRMPGPSPVNPPAPRDALWEAPPARDPLREGPPARDARGDNADDGPGDGGPWAGFRRR